MAQFASSTGLWVISPEEKSRHEALFASLNPVNGKLTGDQAKNYFMMSNLPTPTLGQIWGLADMDGDGKMTLQEFSIGVHLIQAKLRGIEIPNVLPYSLKSSSFPSKNSPSGGSNSSWSQTLIGGAGPQIANGFANRVSGSPSAFGGSNIGGNISHQQPAISFTLGGSFPSSNTVMPQSYSQTGNLSSYGIGTTAPHMQTSAMPAMGHSVSRASVWGHTPLQPSLQGKWTSNSVKLPHSSSAPQVVTQGSIDTAFGDLTSSMKIAPSQGNTTPVSTSLSIISPANRLKYTQMFKASDHDETGLLKGEYARQILIQSNVPPQKLATIWDLSDLNKDGSLDLDEFVIAMHFIDSVKSGQALPQVVPPELIPPNKRLQAGDIPSDGKVRSESTGSGKERSLSIGSAAGDKINPATFEDRRKENFEKGRLELERRRKELQDKMIREKEERERKEREEEERKRRVREEAERRRQQELENERRQREEMEREQETLRKKMIEQRLAAQLESERQRQREWEQRRKEELINQKEHEEEVVAGLKSRLEKLKADLEAKNTNKNDLSVTVGSKKAEASKLMESITMCDRLSEVKKLEIVQLQSDIQQSRLLFSSLKEERERLSVEINKRDTTTTSEALGGVRSSIQQMRNGIPRMKGMVISMEAEAAQLRREIGVSNNHLQSLKESMQTKLEENNQQKQILELKKREYLIYRQRVEEENRSRREEEERLRRELEAKKRKEEQIRKNLEEEARKQKQREQAAMALEEQHQLESLRRVQEVQQADRRRKMEEAKKQAEEALKKQIELKNKERSTTTEIQKEIKEPPRQESLVRKPAPRTDKKSAPPRPTAPPRPSGPPKPSLTNLADSFSGVNFKTENVNDENREFENEKKKEDPSSAAVLKRKRLEEERRKEEEITKRKEEENKRREEEDRRRKEEEKRKEEENKRKEEENKRREEENKRRKEEEDKIKKFEEDKKKEEAIKKEEERKRMELERLSKEEEERRKAEQQAEVRKKIEEMQQKKLEKKQQQQQQQQQQKKANEIANPIVVPAPTTTQKPLRRFKMLFAFDARNPDELSLEENDMVQVDESDTTSPPGWLRGTYKGKTGLFPANYAEPLPPETFSDYVELDPKSIISQQPPVIEEQPVGLVKTEASTSQKVDITVTPLASARPVPKARPVKTAKNVTSSPSSTQSEERTSSPYSSHKAEGDGSDYMCMQGIYDVPSTTPSTSPEPKIPSTLDTTPTSYENCCPNRDQTSSFSLTGPEIKIIEELQVTALYAYRGKKDDQLSFNKNDLIIVSKQRDVWWFGELAGKTGWFPKSYVKVVATVKSPNTSLTDDKDKSDSISTNSGESSSSTATDQLNQSQHLAETSMDEQPMLGECVAIFEYKGQEGDLSFCEGDTISITRKDNEWWEGYCNGRYGLFPANYVQIKEPETLKRKPEVATVISPFTASGPTEISLNNGNLIHVIRKNPSGWWQGELQAKGKKRQIGWFPASHVKLLGQPKPAQKDQVAFGGNETATTEQEDLYAVPQKIKTHEKETYEQVLAIFSYTAQNEDELTFYKGSVINVMSKDGEWWKGDFNGQVGMFPSNYVQLLSDLPDTTGQWYGNIDTAILASMNETERQRQNCIYELINTEQSYMDDLSLTLEIFYNPMAEANILVQEELDTVFVNWRDLIMCNMKLLKAMLVRKKMSPGQKIEAIGDILLEQLPRLTPYIRFCSCQLKACKYLQFKVENDPEFKQFEKKCAGDPRLKQNLPLSSYLLKPLQRLTKYPLMINQILRYTPEKHYDRNNLELGLEKAEELCTKVNENIRLLENSERLEWLQSHTSLEGLGEKLVFNSPTNCLGQRKFLHYSTLFKHKSNKELKAFLFNDFLLLCRDHGSNTKARPFGSLFIAAEQANSAMQLSLYKKPIFLNEVIVKMPSEPEVNETLFHLSHIDRIYTFRAESKNERNMWVSKLQRASEEFIDTERLQRQKVSRARSVLGTGVGKLIVTVVEGADLNSADPTGTSDPYCVVSMGSQEHQTKVIPKTLNPKWNSEMVFTIKDFQRDVLCITVFDRDFFSPNDFLGRTELSIASLLAEGTGPLHKRLLLHEVDTGEILVRLSVQQFHVT